MAMNPEATQVVEGIAGAKAVQALMRVFGDKMVAQWFLYTPEQYVKDLKTAGYVVQSVDASKSDADIGVIVMQASGYTFASGPANLRGTSKLTADPNTWQAAAGQKVDAWKMPSTWLTGLIGGVGVVDALTGYSSLANNRDWKLIEASAAASLLGDGIVRGLRVDGTITAPSGFDVSTQPAFQYLQNNQALQNLQKLTMENQRLSNEIATLRSAQPPRGIPPGIPSYTVNATQPVVNVTEIIPGKGAESIKARTNLVSGASIQKATPEAVRHRTGLVTLTGGR